MIRPRYALLVSGTYVTIAVLLFGIFWFLDYIDPVIVFFVFNGWMWAVVAAIG